MTSTQVTLSQHGKMDISANKKLMHHLNNFVTKPVPTKLKSFISYTLIRFINISYNHCSSGIIVHYFSGA